MTIHRATDHKHAFALLTDEEENDALLKPVESDLPLSPDAHSSELYFLEGCMKNLVANLEAERKTLYDLNERMIYIQVAKGPIPKDIPQKLTKSLQKIAQLFQKFQEHQASYQKGDFKNQNTQPLDKLFIKFADLHSKIPEAYSKLGIKKKQILPPSSCSIM